MVLAFRCRSRSAHRVVRRFHGSGLAAGELVLAGRRHRAFFRPHRRRRLSLARLRTPAARTALADGADSDDEKESAPVSGNPFKQRIKAPSLDGGAAWINTGGPIELKQLRGKFVLLDFWTYCCINCMHILPELKKLEHAYPNELVVIGVHSAKFEAEQDSQKHHRRGAALRHRASGDQRPRPRALGKVRGQQLAQLAADRSRRAT